MFLILTLLIFNVPADIKAELQECYKIKNKRMQELIVNYYQDPKWKESNDLFLENNRAILTKATALLPQLKEASDPWPVVWANQKTLKENKEMKSLLDEHYRITALRDEYISQRDNEYKKICEKMDKLRADLKAQNI